MKLASAGSVGWCMLGASVVLTAFAITLGMASEASTAEDLELSAPGAVAWGVGWLAFAVAGALILARLPRHRMGWLLAGVALLNALGLAVYAYAERAVVVAAGSLPASELALWLSNWVVIPPTPLLAIFAFLLFPDGHPLTPRWRWVGWLSLAAVALVAAHAALAPGVPEGGLGPNPYPVEGADVLAAAWLAVSLCAVLAVVSLVLRYRRGNALERQQIRWIAAAGAVVALGLVGDSIYSAASEHGGLLPLPLVELSLVLMAAGIAIAVLRYRLYDLDLVVNRTLVYGLLTVLVVAGYVGLVLGLAALLDSSGLGVSLVATAVVAVAIQPLRSVIQRRVDRLMYGDRDDPYRALSRLGERLGVALDPNEVLPTIVEEVATGLRLPYAAIELHEDGGRRVAASHGSLRDGRPVGLPLEYRGEPVGELLVGHRAPGESLAPADLRLLADLARQAGVAAHAVRLTQDLRRSRERLVAAREEERRRLRRDLHDGLGPTLAGISLEVESARALVEPDPAAARDLLERIKTEVQEAIGDIRRIAHDLRPPALDELGLLPAVREHADRLGARGNGAQAQPSTSFEVVDCPDDLPSLPAAIEVAAYRIAMEAMTNVARHARARHCTVRIGVNEGLEVEIRDDGRGISPAANSGVGLASMRERAEELGGSIGVESRDGGGTVVRARFPIERALAGGG